MDLQETIVRLTQLGKESSTSSVTFFSSSSVQTECSHLVRELSDILSGRRWPPGWRYPVGEKMRSAFTLVCCD